MKWLLYMDNLQGSKTVTVIWKECTRCGKSKLLSIFSNGHRSL